MAGTQWWGNSVQTIFYQGITSSQTQVTKYTPASIRSTTGQLMNCQTRNNYPPIDVIIEPFIGTEISEVNIPAFAKRRHYFNPVKITTALIAHYSNRHNGIHFEKNNDVSANANLKFHSLDISKISLGQETDIASHFKKYQLWKNTNRSDLVLWGVSKGAASTFNAFAKYKYPEVKLVVLEGCFAEIQDVLKSWFSPRMVSIANRSLSLFTQYKKEGDSPIKNVENFPENVPIVFVTSRTDTVVPATSTKRLAMELATRGKNDVYYLELINSKHANYMFSNQVDRDCYEAFIHAIYQKYGLPHIPNLAEKGKNLMIKSQLSSIASPQNRYFART